MSPQYGTQRKNKQNAKKTRKVSEAVKGYVKKLISVNAENKLAQPVSANNVEVSPYGYGLTPLTGTLIDITPVISGVIQGTAQGHRVGNVIKAKKLNFRGYLNMSPTDLTYGTNKDPVYLKMVIGRKKNCLDAPVNFADLLQNGSTNLAPLNLPTDMVRPLNRDYYQIFKTKVFPLACSTASNQGGQAVPAPHKLTQKFSIDLTKHVNFIKFSDAVATPTNCAFFCWFLMSRWDGTAIGPLAAAIPCVEIHYDCNLTYEDN